MSLQRRRNVILVLSLIVLTSVPACSSRNINSGMDEQVAAHSSKPAEPPAEASVPVEAPVEAKVSPPERVEEPEVRLPEPAGGEPPPSHIAPTMDPIPTLTDVYFD